MPDIDGISFDDGAYQLVSKLIAMLKEHGDSAVYGLPRMHKRKGEIRIAHLGPDPKHKKARGVFVQIRPTATGATILRRRAATGGQLRTPLTAKNINEMLEIVASWREQVARRKPISEKVEPNQPGTVSGGQFESKRSKH